MVVVLSEIAILSMPYYVLLCVGTVLLIGEEISPTKLRGLLGAANQVAVTLGMFHSSIAMLHVPSVLYVSIMYPVI